MAKTNDQPVKISEKYLQLLRRVKEDTGASHKFIVEKALQEKYPEYLKEKGEK